jgi:methionyl-tRNA formyltransferase
VRVIFCGNPEFALPTLDMLLDSGHDVVAVVTSPDKPQGRGRKIQPLPVKEHALQKDVTVLQPETLRDEDFLNSVRDLSPDALVVVAFRILPRELFTLPRFGSFNVHPSLLPRGRGPAPIQWTLLRGETETGVSIIHLNEVIDGGAILAQELTSVGDNEDFGALHDRLAVMGAHLLLDVLQKFERGNPPQAILQDETQITRAPKLKPLDYRIDWTMSARDIRNRIRAFSPQPGAFTLVAGRILKILSADEWRGESQLVCGELKKSGEDCLLAGTGSGTLQLKVIQPEGKRAMTVADFLRGRPALPERLD